jgi:hypothetical protein
MRRIKWARNVARIGEKKAYETLFGKPEENNTCKI